jgi:hypothetical protein
MISFSRTYLAIAQFCKLRGRETELTTFNPFELIKRLRFPHFCMAVATWLQRWLR